MKLSFAAMPSLCQNADCCFSKTGSRLRAGAGVQLCAFCDYEAMETACLTASGRRSILRSLKAMTNPNFRDIAMEQVPDVFKEHFACGLASGQFCGGFEGEVCIFALTKTGGPAQVGRRRAGSCLFCDPTAIGAKVDAPNGLKEIAKALRQMSEAGKEKALAERLPEDVRAQIRELIAPKPQRRRLGLPPQPADLRSRWAPLLAKRQNTKPPASATEKKLAGASTPVGPKSALSGMRRRTLRPRFRQPSAPLEPSGWSAGRCTTPGRNAPSAASCCQRT